MSRRSAGPTALAAQALSLSFAVPQVIAQRTLRMLTAGPSPSRADRQEWTRMSAEKVAAFHESWQAIAVAMWRAQLQLALHPWQWWGSPWLTPAQRSRRATRFARKAGHAMASAGLAPVARRVHANVRRLGRPTAR